MAFGAIVLIVMAFSRVTRSSNETTQVNLTPGAVPAQAYRELENRPLSKAKTEEKNIGFDTLEGGRRRAEEYFYSKTVEKKEEAKMK